MKIALLGFAKEGRSAYEYWNQAGNEITICDISPELKVPDGAESQLGPDYLKNLDKFDLLVRTPVLHPKNILQANPQNPEILNKVTSVTNEFFKVSPTKNIIGITGTKGKGTTSTLISKMLEADGKRVHLGGNIGVPALELLKNNIKPEDWVVLELSSFQLFDLKSSPHIAVCLMVVSEHLDWHADMAEYMDAKQQLFMNQSEKDIAIYFAENENSEAIADASVGRQIPYYAEPGAYIKDASVVIDGHEICKTSEIKLLGEHNWQNVCAAVTTAWQVTQNIEAIKSVITNFTGLEHRLEFVRELDGVKYYDDSFGTTPETAIVAIEAFSEPKIVILGGSDKGSDYENLVNTVVEKNAKSVIAIGPMGGVIAELLRNNNYDKIVDGGKTMDEIVSNAKKLATAGDVVLLSTGCASFGLFDNYKDRGEKFKQSVLAL